MSLRLLPRLIPRRSCSLVACYNGPAMRSLSLTTPTRFLHTSFRPQNSHTSLTNILASDTPLAVQIASVTEEGILLEDGLLLPAACILLDGKVFLWDVPDKTTQWGREHLAMFEVVVPRPGLYHSGE